MPFARSIADALRLAPLAALLVGAVAVAADPGSSPAAHAVEKGDRRASRVATTSPPFRTVAFADREGDCDPAAARRGRCIERVDFLPLDAPDAKAADALSRLYAELWEGLAYSWREQDLAKTLAKAGYDALPSPPRAFGRVTEGGRPTAMPRPATVLDRDRWEGPEGWFAPIRDAAPWGQAVVPPVVVLSGRFAERLGYDGKRYDYQLMDADPTTSGPFFEQMYPYARARELEAAWPLSQLAFRDVEVERSQGDFQKIREELWKGILFEGGYDELAEDAGAAMDEFQARVGSRILANALQDWTPTHVRVLTALVAMREPPRTATEMRRGTEVVAAAAGQTDEAGAADVEASAVHALRDAHFTLRYDQLPRPVVDEWLGQFEAWQHPSPKFLEGLQAVYASALAEYVRDHLVPLSGTEDAALQRWVLYNALPGHASDLDLPMRQLALRTLVGGLAPDARDAWESRILLDHLAEAIGSTFDPGASAPSTPAAVESAAGDQWERVLDAHGLSPSKMGEGLGAVDPLAICTTKEGRDALEEPSFRPVDVDLVVAAPAGLTSAEAILWPQREKLPFLMIDQPAATAPDVHRVVDLPEGQSLYRVHWRLWSGWHLFWTSVPAGLDRDGEERMVLRTGAVCDDMALTTPDLVATLVRADLLAGDAFPTDPPDARSRVRRDVIDENGAAADQGRGAAQSAPQEAESTRDTAEKASKDVSVGLDAAAGEANDLMSARGSDEPAAELVAKDPGLAWLRSVVDAPLRKLAGEQGLLLFVLDDDGRTGKFEDRPLRTPYARAPLEEGQVAGWTWWYDPKHPRSLVAPASRGTETVAVDADAPRWRRSRTWEGNVLLGAGAIPYRSVRFDCAPDAPGVASGDVVSACPADDTALSQGFGVDSAVLGTWWFADDARTAIEAGPLARLDTRPAGPSLVDGESPTYTWAFRPQVGMTFGLRFAPDPAPLQRRHGQLWGVSRLDGTAVHRRWQLGVRGSAAVGPGYGGLESTFGVEGWASDSIVRKRAVDAHLLAWRPDLLVGPYARVQWSFPVGAPDDRWLTIDRSTLVSVGVTGQLRIGR